MINIDSIWGLFQRVHHDDLIWANVQLKHELHEWFLTWEDQRYLNLQLVSFFFRGTIRNQHTYETQARGSFERLKMFIWYTSIWGFRTIKVPFTLAAIRNCWSNSGQNGQESALGFVKTNTTSSPVWSTTARQVRGVRLSTGLSSSELVEDSWAWVWNLKHQLEVATQNTRRNLWILVAAISSFDIRG